MDSFTLTQPVSTAVLLEGVMLVCFGLAWPVANLRMLLRREAEGKGLAFTAIILCGYAAGAASKLFGSLDAGAVAPILWLYVVNLLSVGVNLGLQGHFGRRAGRVSVPARSEPSGGSPCPAGGSPIVIAAVRCLGGACVRRRRPA